MIDFEDISAAVAAALPVDRRTGRGIGFTYSEKTLRKAHSLFGNILQNLPEEATVMELLEGLGTHRDEGETWT